METKADAPLILVVDDEAHIRHVVELKLAGAGYRVLTAEDGELGLSLALEHRPDLVITDYQMPFMSGLDLCARLKSHDATAATPALMLTARGFTLPAEQVARANIVTVMAKPFSPRELLNKVRALVGEPASRSEVTGSP